MFASRLRLLVDDCARRSSRDYTNSIFQQDTALNNDQPCCRLSCSLLSSLSRDSLMVLIFLGRSKQWFEFEGRGRSAGNPTAVFKFFEALTGSDRWNWGLQKSLNLNLNYRTESGPIQCTHYYTLVRMGKIRCPTNWKRESWINDLSQNSRLLEITFQKPSWKRKRWMDIFN